MEGFPETLAGELLFCPADNLNTDGIYPGKYTYIDDFTPEQQAEVVMENYDPDFGKKLDSMLSLKVSATSFQISGSGHYIRSGGGTNYNYSYSRIICYPSCPDIYNDQRHSGNQFFIPAPQTRTIRKIGRAHV